MTEQVGQLPDPIVIDKNKLHLFPDPAGMQHCEISSVLDSYPRWFPKRWRRSWNEQPRPDIPAEACHPTVFQRFDLPAVRKLGVNALYRPAILRHDRALKKYYL
jgi:hypothetical protein